VAKVKRRPLPLLEGGSMNSKYILEMNHITKLFPGVKALDDVLLQLRPHTVLGVVGENGAGKSTLMKILSGVYPCGEYTGEIRIDGKPRIFHNVADSEAAGISIIYQELMLFPELSIAENITLRTSSRLINQDDMYAEAAKWMQLVGLEENPELAVKHIGVGKQQLVEIAKALSLNTKILILDEPTSALTKKDVDHLHQLIDNLRSQGVSCIYISHKLEEILQICDDVTILRDGKTIDTRPIAELDEQTIISLMVGRNMANRFPPKLPSVSQEIVFEVKNLNLTKAGSPEQYILKDINFQLYRGEILGIAGLMGAGRTELVNSIFGDFKGDLTGEILVDGNPVKIQHPKHAIQAGLGLCTEDRKFNGLNLIESVEKNVVIASIDRYTKWGVVDRNTSAADVKALIQKTNVKAPSIETLAMNLSGGNQQKVVISKWMMLGARIMIFDEPTRGIDVGTKYEIYCLMNELKKQGVSIIMVSSEMPEILGVSDRIVILNQGVISGELDGNDATEVAIMEKLI